MLLHNLQRSPAALSSSVSWNKRLRLLIVIISNESKIKLVRTQKEKQSVTARCVNVKICDFLSMSELDFPLSKPRKLEEGGESFCSCMGLDTSPLTAPMNEIVLCCLLCLTSPETVPVRICSYFKSLKFFRTAILEPLRSHFEKIAQKVAKSKYFSKL